MRLYEIINETASSGGTSAGNVASVPGGLWNGPVLGRYPFYTIDWKAAGLTNPNAFPKKTIKRKKQKK